MGAAQYLCDFQRDHHIKKSAELRKRVMQREEKRKEKSDSVPFQVWCHVILYTEKETPCVKAHMLK